MNAPTDAKAAPSAPAAAIAARPQRSREDREFLPAALEILESPPSPARIYLLLLICAFVVVAIAWSFFGRIDIIAIAQGKIQPTGRVKIVQNAEVGKVRNVLISNGARVEAGDPLVQLDDAELSAEEKTLATGLSALQAEITRRTASLNIVRSRKFENPTAVWPVDIPKAVRAREERVLVSDVGQLSASYESLAAQRRQKEAEGERLSDTIKQQKELIAIEQQRVDMRAILEKSKTGSKASLIDAMETLQTQRTQLSQQTGQLSESRAAIDTIDRDITKLVETFIGEHTQKLADAERQADEFEQRLIKARVHLANMTLRSPSAGTVQSLSITTTGQVLAAGDEVMRIVPADMGLEIECYIQNKDIAFVSVGQEAVVKIESFPFTQYGSLPATVTRVGREAIPEPDVQQLEAGAGKATNRNNSFLGGGQRVQNLVFPITLKPERLVLKANASDLPISNGMTVSVEIRTGSRRIIDYIFSPLVEIGSRAMRER